MQSQTRRARRLELVVAGHVTRDLIRGEERLGGAAAFAARAASHFGVRTGVLTAAPADFDLIAPLLSDRNIRVARAEAAQATTFELDYSGPVRRVRLLDRAPDLVPADVPESYRRARLAYIAPVCGECGRELIAGLEARRVVVGAQGWMRAFAEDGLVVPALMPEAEDPPQGIFAVVFSELDHPEAEQLAKRFARSVPVVALTRGSAGATLFVDGAPHRIAAVPAVEQDPTGAGDVFGLVLGIAIDHGVDPLEAAHLAAAACARLVEGPGLGRLPEFCASAAWRQVMAA